MMRNSFDIALEYDLIHIGAPQDITHPGSLIMQSPGKLLWAKSIDSCSTTVAGILVTDVKFQDSLQKRDNLTYLLTSKSPRLIFAKIVNDLFPELRPDNFKNDVERHRANKNIKIGLNCFIGENVTIGDGTEILHNTSIFSNCNIGSNCQINSNVSIGTSGLGFEYDGDSIVEFPQLGRVIIGDNVLIGPGSTIRRGALDDTIVESGCKVGSLCNIGHNCKVGKLSILTTQVAMGGSSEIGEKAFLGIGSCLNNKVKIGANVTVGAGAVVTKSFGDNLTIGGVPAKILKG